jgi:magnesium chelatase family protein
MLSKVRSAAVTGIDAYPVEVEVNSGSGDTQIVIVGLPDTAVKEARDRVLTAISNSAYYYTFGRTTINLAPADVKKEGPSFDLPIAIGMLAAGDQIEPKVLDEYMMVGELALDGAVRPVKGVLPIALRARADGKKGLLVPVDNAREAAVVSGLDVIPVRNLREAASFLEGEAAIQPMKVDIASILDHPCDDDIDFAEVKGQESVKRALEIAAAGAHNILLLSTIYPQRAVHFRPPGSPVGVSPGTPQNPPQNSSGLTPRPPALRFGSLRVARHCGTEMRSALNCRAAGIPFLHESQVSFTHSNTLVQL